MGGNLRRGFKTEAEKLALEVRAELGLGPHDRLEPKVLANHFEIPILSLSELGSFGARQESIDHFLQGNPQDFSAMTVFRRSFRLIVENTAQRDSRRVNSVAHELAHVILEHEPHEALNSIGCRQWNPVMEDEADWLAGALLVPRLAALQVARTKVPLPVACASFGVGISLMRWRLHHTGVRKQVDRERARWR